MMPLRACQRYRSRRTVDGIELPKRIVAIHAADKPPKLRYYVDTARSLTMPQQQPGNIERP